MNWINSIKAKEGYKKVSFTGHSREAEIFVEVYKNLPSERFALIIHDCILCLEEDTAQIKQLLIDRVRKLYSEVLAKDSSLNNLFKSKLVSISDEELLKNKNSRLVRENLSKNPDIKKD
jgi:hypothetical protein